MTSQRKAHCHGLTMCLTLQGSLSASYDTLTAVQPTTAWPHQERVPLNNGEANPWLARISPSSMDSISGKQTTKPAEGCAEIRTEILHIYVVG